MLGSKSPDPTRIMRIKRNSSRQRSFSTRDSDQASDSYQASDSNQTRDSDQASDSDLASDSDQMRLRAMVRPCGASLSVEAGDSDG